MTEQRRLAAIVSADVAGYSRLMGKDESGTLAALKAIRLEVVDPVIASHGGRIVKTTGDGLPGMAQCIERTVRMWRFPKSGGDSPVKFPLVFQPGS